MTIIMRRFRAGQLAAATWAPAPGVRIGWTTTEQQAVNLAAGLIVANALHPSSQQPIGAILRVLDRAVGL